MWFPLTDARQCSIQCMRVFSSDTEPASKIKGLDIVSLDNNFSSNFRRKTMEQAIPEEASSLSRKFISIAAGEAHTLALTGDGRVFSWGRGTFGRLGTGSETDQSFPDQVKFLGADVDKEEKLKIVSITAGAYHSLALADDGSVWAWGYNAYGQIGLTGENVLEPHLLEFCESDSSTESSEAISAKPLKISSVKAGGMMSLAIDSVGELWMWGNYPDPPQTNSSDQEPSTINITSPIKSPSFHGHKVVKVACGNEHVIVLVGPGETRVRSNLICYSWGGNSHGQLGLGDKESRSHPEVIETFNSQSPWEIYGISCGSLHTAILAKQKQDKENSESFCWTFGSGDNGQLGHGTTQCSLSPELVKGLPNSIFLVSVDCGLFHTSVVSSVGEVWSWGMEKGLGLCPDARFTGTDAGDAIFPILIPHNGIHDHRFRDVVQIACGASHTVLLADGGYKLWSWGRGISGVLGNGNTIDSYAPALVLWPPLANDFKPEESSEEKKEIEEQLGAALEEMKFLKTKVLSLERYASLLHGSIFGKPFQENEIPASLQNTGNFDIGKEWENMLESSDSRKLVRLEMFYNDMLSGVKNKLMKKMIQETVEECLKAAGGGST